jgi:cytochrome c peroxidase
MLGLFATSCGYNLLATQPRNTVVRSGPPCMSTSRREAIAAAATAALAAGLKPLPAMAVTDYGAVADSLGAMIDADPNVGPTMLRLAWHSSGTYSKITKDGGSGGGTIRFKEELAHGGNAGLDKMVAKLEPIKKRFPDVSYADLYTLAGKVAIEAAGGPEIAWRAGRVDELSPEAVTPDGRLPDADKGSPAKNAVHLRTGVFYRMGFNDREIVCLSGAHALGRAHADASGYSGPWTPAPTALSNSFFNLLLNVEWTPKQWDGPLQFEDPTGKLMMMPSDMVLIEDPKFRKHVVTYAKDNDLFLKDFGAAVSKLFELGTTGLYSVPVTRGSSAAVPATPAAASMLAQSASKEMVGLGLAQG